MEVAEPSYFWSLVWGRELAYTDIAHAVFHIVVHRFAVVIVAHGECSSTTFRQCPVVQRGVEESISPNHPQPQPPLISDQLQTLNTLELLSKINAIANIRCSDHQAP